MLLVGPKIIQQVGHNLYCSVYSHAHYRMYWSSLAVYIVGTRSAVGIVMKQPHSAAPMIPQLKMLAGHLVIGEVDII